MMIKILYLARSQGAAPELVERRGAAFNARLHARQSVAVTAVPAYSSAHVRDFLSGAESSGPSGDAARISHADAGDGQGSRRQTRRRFLLSVPRGSGQRRAKSRQVRPRLCARIQRTCDDGGGFGGGDPGGGA